MSRGAVHCVEQPVVEALRAAGHDVVALTEGPRGLTDDEILHRAEAESRALVTNDKDFGELVFRLRRTAAGVVLLRLATEDGVRKAERLTQVMPTVQTRLAGHFGVVTDQRVRLRPPPPTS